MKTQRKNIWLAALILLMLHSAGNFASAQTSLQKARELKANLDYAQAIAMYNDHMASLAIPAVEHIRELAECYLMVNEPDAAGAWLAKIIAWGGHTAEDVFHYANILKMQGKYEEAIRQYRNWAALAPEKEAEAASQVRACEMSLQWMADPLYFDVTNAEHLNSENSDFGLISFVDGYLFASDRATAKSGGGSKNVYGWTGNPFLKIFYASGTAAASAPPVPVQALNNDYHNGALVYDKNSKTIYFTRTRMVKVAKKPLNNDPTSWIDRSSADGYVNRLEIYSAQYANGKWTQVKPFRHNDSESYSVGHPAISPDGSVLYFVSDMPGGYGGTDIYYCERLPDGEWGKPRNAGGAVNTSGKEVFPTIGPDGAMYFSSDGHPGMGGLDIFSVRGARDRWDTPGNLRYPLNSSRDDFSIYFTETGTAGYLTSAREGGKGSDDIYSFVYAPPKTLVLAGITKARLEDNTLAELGFVDLKVMDDKGNTIRVISDVSGLFYLPLDCGGTYTIQGMKEGYFAGSASAEAICKSRNDTVFVELVLDKIIINKPIVLDNIYYDYNKWNIRPDAALELEKLVKILTENPAINIELGSHTDSRGTREYNQRLSQRRAESAVAYIISRGIKSSRITAMGYGESAPVNRCVDGVYCSEEEHQMNRRTEFRVTSIDSKYLGYGRSD
jgi:outer membrane protein OmpA-like peptidoglycan-associated protein/tetratricopeptide (TPR) repeat protein